MNDIMSDAERAAQKERIRILRIIDNSTDMMLKKNKERGSCSGQIGLLGLFLEVRTMFLRLRHLIWDVGPPDAKIVKGSNNTVPDYTEYVRWYKDTQNALQDLRNYTVLAELALIDRNMKGTGDDSILIDKKHKV